MEHYRLIVLVMLIGQEIEMTENQWLVIVFSLGLTWYHSAKKSKLLSLDLVLNLNIEH